MADNAAGNQRGRPFQKGQSGGREEGDPTAMRLCVERLIPVRKGHPITFELSPVETPSDITKALGTVAKGMAEGELTPDEATMIGSVIEMKRRAIETVELEQRLRVLEERLPK